MSDKVPGEGWGKKTKYTHGKPVRGKPVKKWAKAGANAIKGIPAEGLPRPKIYWGN